MTRCGRVIHRYTDTEPRAKLCERSSRGKHKYPDRSTPCRRAHPQPSCRKFSPQAPVGVTSLVKHPTVGHWPTLVGSRQRCGAVGSCQRRGTAGAQAEGAARRAAATAQAQLTQQPQTLGGERGRARGRARGRVTREQA
eukprot:scaffold10717_cov61-Phaeocystis_antarctica.AAC.4